MVSARGTGAQYIAPLTLARDGHPRLGYTPVEPELLTPPRAFAAMSLALATPRMLARLG